MNSWQKQHDWERENWCSAVHMGVKCIESGTKQCEVTELNGLSDLRNRGTERISCYERRKLISQVRRPQRPQQLSCWEKMKTLMFILTSHSACETLLMLHLLKRGENEGQRNCWRRKLKQRRAVNQPPWPGPPKYDITLRWESKRQA